MERKKERRQNIKRNSKIILNGIKESNIFSDLKKTNLNKENYEKKEKKPRSNTRSFSDEMRQSNFSFTLYKTPIKPNVKKEYSKIGFLLPCNENYISFNRTQVPLFQAEKSKINSALVGGKKRISLFSFTKEIDSKINNNKSDKSEKTISIIVKEKKINEKELKNDLFTDLNPIAHNSSLNLSNKSIEDILAKVNTEEKKENKLPLQSPELIDLKKESEKECKSPKNSLKSKENNLLEKKNNFFSIVYRGCPHISKGKKKSKFNKKLSLIPEAPKIFSKGLKKTKNNLHFSSPNIKASLNLSLALELNTKENKIKKFPRSSSAKNAKFLFNKLIQTNKKNKIKDSSDEKGDVEEGSILSNSPKKKAEISNHSIITFIGSKNSFDMRRTSIKISNADHVFNHENPKAQKQIEKLNNNIKDKIEYIEWSSIEKKDQLLSKALLLIDKQMVKLEIKINEKEFSYNNMIDIESITAIKLKEYKIFTIFGEKINENLSFSNFKPFSIFLFSIYFDINIPYLIYKKHYLSKEIEGEDKQNIIDAFNIKNDKDCKKCLSRTKNHKIKKNAKFDHIFQYLEFPDLSFCQIFLQRDIPIFHYRKTGIEKMKKHTQWLINSKNNRMKKKSTKVELKQIKSSKQLTKRALLSFKSSFKGTNLSFEGKSNPLKYGSIKSIHKFISTDFFSRKRDEAENLHMEKMKSLQENMKRTQELQRQQLFNTPYFTSGKNYLNILEEIKEEENQNDYVEINKEITMVKTNKIKIDMLKRINNYHHSLTFFVKDGNNRKFKELFKKYNVNTELEDEKGNSFLNLAAQAGNIEICLFLLAKGANINSQNKKGNTPLHYSLGNKNYELSDLLLQYGANERVRNYSGLTPWQYLDSINSFI